MECGGLTKDGLKKIEAEMKKPDGKRWKCAGCLEKDNEQLKKKVYHLEDRLNTIEQKSKENNLIISGIVKQEIQTTEIVTKIMETMEINVEMGDIKCNRINKKEDSPILVQFPNKTYKMEVFKKRKELKTIRSDQCGLKGEKQIYFNDDLILYYQNLFKKAREFKKDNRLKAVYCLSGRIHIIVKEGDTPKIIRKEADLLEFSLN
ncbi:unnamed protein product [Brassicogethes aeneus]|uniref:Uncharacterized protein n=1 Tax=Brassicogethes aeneus TaxID=1431903 RepID=A0A9P0BFA2_BRAAE|nr:unnamed protein product [Brassicogethes aeneus]